MTIDLNQGYYEFMTHNLFLYIYLAFKNELVDGIFIRSSKMNQQIITIIAQF